MKKRIGKIQKARKKKELEAFLVDSDVNRYYCTGFRATAGHVLFTPDNCYLLVDFRYYEQAQKMVDGYQVLEYKEDFVDTLKNLLEEEGIDELGFESTAISYQKYEKYNDKLSPQLVPVKGLIEELRLIKEKEEIESIKKAVEIADSAFEHILHYIKPGLREDEIALELEYYMKKNGGEKNSFDFIVASGKRSSLPHGLAGDRKLKKGDLVILDFGTKWEGYCSDITRTVILGSAGKKQEEIYNLVLEAQKCLRQEICPGITGKEADALARDIIETAGYGDYFGHGSGHGLGLRVHEGPRLSHKSDRVLEPGMVVTAEPGVYIPDFGGVRIEDNLVITTDGCEVLSSSPRKLEFIII